MTTLDSQVAFSHILFLVPSTFIPFLYLSFSVLSIVQEKWTTQQLFAQESDTYPMPTNKPNSPVRYDLLEENVD